MNPPAQREFAELLVDLLRALERSNAVSSSDLDLHEATANALLFLQAQNI